MIDASIESFVFEITGAAGMIDEFIDLMRPIGLVEVSRTGVAAMPRGPIPMRGQLLTSSGAVTSIATKPIHSGSYQGRHEFRTHRIGNQLPQDPIDLGFSGGIEGPPDHVVHWLQLTGTARAPQRGGDTLVEYPTDRQVNDALAETFLGQLIEALHGGEILTEPGLLEFRVYAT